MREKKPSAIKKITLNRATFQDVTVDRLSFVNFFYGNNGTGKSTIARCIKNSDGVEWVDGRSPENFEIAVYDRDFISDNFSDYSGMKGVFTVGKENIESQKLEEKKIQQKDLRVMIEAAEAELANRQKEPGRLREAFQDECFERCAKIRNDFDAALDRRKQKKGFADAILEEQNPVDHDLDALKRLCDTAFDDTAKEYQKFSYISSALTFGGMPGMGLLGRPIVSRSDTPFAQFIKALNATDWVRAGHEQYMEKADGKCPLCQRELEDDFESEIAACFDEQYQQDISDLEDFRDTYVRETEQILDTLGNNLLDVLPSLDLTGYKDKLDLLKSSIDLNRQRLAEKVNEPTKVISLENIDSRLQEIRALIDEINQAIEANNDVVKGRRASQDKCRDELMQYLAFFLKDNIKRYRTETITADRAIDVCKDKLSKLEDDYRSLAGEIAVLSSHTVNTSDAMNAINNMLTETGFQGFRLRAKEDVDNTYEVIRGNGEIASDLSEGERNFIAFLYFHQMVCGSLNQGESKDKIVVIDDPVSSMDSKSLFFISGIVRTMISVCRNNTDYRSQKVSGDFIKQIFILTHNVYFHKEITYQQVGYHDCTSFYMIRKDNNVSSVKLCERQSAVPTEVENYNPVQNSYAALWDELRDVQSANTAKNVMRRILEYYFIQFCGYEGESLVESILESEEGRGKFIVQKEDGTPDISNYEMAMSLLSYINTAHDVVDDICFAEDSENVEAYKNVFRMIFDAMGQSQHYNMMMGVQKES